MEKPLRILIVEDSEDDAELVMRFARQNRAKPEFVRVDTESQMREALSTSQWDLVISDYNLPSFSGLDAIKTLRKLGLDIPLIIVSGTIGEDKAIETLKTGATDYVLKSNLGRLPSAIDRAHHEVQIQRQQRETERQLVQAQKMEAVGRLAAGVAHDVNNVLAAITLFAEVAMEQIQSSDPTQAKESLEGILKSQETAAAIIRQLLMFSRRRLGPSEVVDFASVLSDIRALITRLVGEDIAVSLRPLSETLSVSADRTQLEQIILNLAVNARDAMPTGGSLDLTLEVQQLEAIPAGVRISIQPGRYVVLTFHDTGCGMPEAVQQRLFEPFFTTKEPGKGTGLGLSVIFGILRQAGGSVSVESAPGQGTTFRIYWPVASEAKAVDHSTRPTAREIRAPSGPLTVLLVEDEETLRKIMASTLRKQGHVVLEAAHGEEGFQILLNHRAQISLLITDIVMPRMGGPELLKKAREIRPDLCVLFLSGYVDATLQDYQVDTNSTWFLEKPFSSRAFTEKVAKLLNGEPSV